MTSDEIDQSERERLERVIALVATVERRRARRLAWLRFKTGAALILVVVGVVFLLVGYVVACLGGAW